MSIHCVSKNKRYSLEKPSEIAVRGRDRSFQNIIVQHIPKTFEIILIAMYNISLKDNLVLSNSQPLIA